MKETVLGSFSRKTDPDFQDKQCVMRFWDTITMGSTWIWGGGGGERDQICCWNIIPGILCFRRNSFVLRNYNGGIKKRVILGMEIKSSWKILNLYAFIIWANGKF